jgi:hypothetical protein
MTLNKPKGVNLMKENENEIPKFFILPIVIAALLFIMAVYAYYLWKANN